MSAFWVVTASADHIRRGREGNFVQAGHGKVAPLKRIKPGDGIVCYSPTRTFGGKDRLQAFTAIGTVGEGEPYQRDMGEGWRPYRRDVVWCEANETPIRPMLPRLEFTAGGSGWGYRFRFGLFSISEHDFGVIERAMRAEPDSLD